LAGQAWLLSTVLQSQPSAAAVQLADWLAELYYCARFDNLNCWQQQDEYVFNCPRLVQSMPALG